jgi:excisionase family DNA binding protein
MPLFIAKLPPVRGAPEEMTLQEAADHLGIHYMTAYRHVRLGRLPAVKRDGQWRVSAADVEALSSRPTTRGRGTRRFEPSRLADRLVAGDEPGAWAIVESLLVGGAEPADVHVHLLGPALTEVGDRWAAGTISVADEHRATAVAHRLLGRLGPRFRRAGRARGTVLVAGVPGDSHGLPGALLSDVLRSAHFDVVELGPDTPLLDLETAGRAAGSSLRAVCLSFAVGGRDDEVATVVSALRSSLGVPVLVGGPACDGPVHAARLGADGTAGDALGVVALLA